MRERGYYWIRLLKDGRVMVARWITPHPSRVDGYWMIARLANHYTDADFDFIGEKIEPPDMPERL